LRWLYGTSVVKKSKVHYINTGRFFGFFNLDRDSNTAKIDDASFYLVPKPEKDDQKEGTKKLVNHIE